MVFSVVGRGRDFSYAPRGLAKREERDGVSFLHAVGAMGGSRFAAGSRCFYRPCHSKKRETNSNHWRLTLMAVVWTGKVNGWVRV